MILTIWLVGLEVKAMTCPIEIAVNLIGDKWKILILKRLLDHKILRFGELSRELVGISQKMLSQQLRRMEQDGLVIRTIYASIPPRVEYSLTDLGKSLDPVVDVLYQWGKYYVSLSS